MSFFETNVVRTPSYTRRASFWKWCLVQLITWHAAWIEKQKLMRLDAAALHDMAIDPEARDNVTVSEIAARMRAQRG